MNQHTPGPWKVRQAFDKGEPCELVVHAGAIDIASLAYGELEQEDADARLIAAAQEMLEAVKALLLIADDGPIPGAARALLAKIEGEKVTA